MPVVKIKRILSVSSEDSVHCADNLLSPAVGLQWLCRNDNKCKKAEVVLELAKLSRIKQMEIGNSGSAFVEVLVRDTMEGIYVSLLPQSMLMSAEESKSGRNLSRTKHFSTDRLSKVATEKKWLYVKLVCLQPFSISRQFGLRHIVLLSHTPDESTPTKTLLSPLSPGLLVSPKPVTTPHRITGTSSVTPSGQRSTEIKASKTTPSRRRKRITEDDGLDFEFSGLENQSRLLNNTLKNDPSTIKGNPILSRIAAERQSVVRNQEELGDELSSEKGFIRKKLLTKELPKVESVDFLESYSVKDQNDTSRYSLLKLSNLDNSAEIGADDHKERKRRNQTASPGQWISARKKHRNTTVKPPTPLDIPNNFELFPTTSTEQKSLDSYFQRDVINNEVICIDDDESNDITNAPITSEPLLITDDVPCNQPGDNCAQCPVCGVWFPLYAVEVHASQCAERTYGNSSSDAIHV